RAAAFAVDGLQNTRPIEYPVQAPKEADAMFDVLTYEKGASVLRMLEQHLSPLVFRDGVRDYLRTHAYGNADTKDLWISLGKAAQQPVPELMNGWIFQPGYPLVHARMAGDSELILTQKRFTYLPHQESEDQTWHIPVQLRLETEDSVEHHRLLLTETDMRIALPSTPRQLVVNEGGHGFYRVHYETSLLTRLIDTGLDHLAPTERFNLVSDAWATTVSGLMPLSDYLTLTRHFAQERDKNVWTVLIESLSFLHRIIADDDRSALEAFTGSLIGPAIQELGWAPRPDDNDLLRQLRGDLLGALGKLGNDRGVQAEASIQYMRYQEDQSTVDPNIVPAIVTILAHTGNEARYEEFSERAKHATTPQEERRYLFSLAAFRSPALLERTLARTIDGGIRTQDAPFVVGASLGNVSGRETAWEFAKQNWDQMDKLFPKQGLRRMCGGIVHLATPELEQDVRTFFASRQNDLGGKTLDQYLEQLRIAVAFKERNGAVLRQHLLSQTS
ncbi:MAG: M1 family metallopeptidase, partial [Nitrospira sp.]|nr:M1 family metallopeptidase [Nitrospira sp.]